MMRPVLTAVLVSMMSGTAAAAEERTEDAAEPAQDRIVAGVLSATEAPAAALIVVGPDGPLALAVGGVRRAGGDEPVRIDDAWHIGSNAKAMTATLALKLAEEGTISLDDAVPDVLGAAYRVHEDWGAVTLRHLLSHRGGVAPNIGRLTFMRLGIFGAETAAEAPADRRSVFKGMLKRPPSGEVGTYQYSNLGYTLAGEMLQEAAGASFEALLADRLFAPLGMGEPVFGAPVGPNTIRGHTGSPPSPRPGNYDNPLAMAPAGTISLPVDAYAAFLTDQLRGQMNLDGLLDPASYEALATPAPGESYTLGWGLTPDGQLGHSGSNTAWYATTVVDAEAGLAVAVLTNAGAASALNPHVLKALEVFRPR